MAKNLNIKYRYYKIKPVKYRITDIRKLSNNPIQTSTDWNKSEFQSIKRLVRFIHYKSQNRRCAYCRRFLNPLGINEHIDHLVARTINHGWMFKPKNLVLTCYQCNTQKTNLNILHDNWSRNRLPKKPENYKYFNPYLHNWHEHFEIEDSLFIKALTTEGEETITNYKLYDYKFSMIYAQESNIFDATAIKRANRRLIKYDVNTNEYKSAKKLIDEIGRHI